MTTATVPAPARPRVSGGLLRSPARLLRLELRRNVMPWLLPLLAALFWLTTYRPAIDGPTLWNYRAGMLQTAAMLGFAPVLAGAAAWSGSREGRRGITDLVGITGLPRWAARLAAWAAITFWAEAAYLAGVAVVYGITARQATWGGPLLWPIAVGAATAAAACAVGFAAGALAPSRFTAPLSAVVVFLALGGGAFALQSGARPTYSQIWPLDVQGGFPNDTVGIFYHYFPDLAVAQIMFVGGLGAAALGALGLPATAGGRWLRGIAVAVTVAGLAAAGTAVGLAGTARLEPHGIVIPALHNSASDRPVGYTPVCASGAVPVCLHPAYRSYMPQVAAAVDPLLDELAGLPAAPARVVQVAFTTVQQSQSGGNGVNLGGPVITGRPPVLELPLSNLTLPGGGTDLAAFTGELRSELPPLLNAFVGEPAPVAQPGTRAAVVPPGPGRAAQVAVALTLAKDAGLVAEGSLGSGQTGPGAVSALAAARRFAALPAAARHAWLLTHLTALRAGHITLSEIP